MTETQIGVSSTSVTSGVVELEVASICGWERDLLRRIYPILKAAAAGGRVQIASGDILREVRAVLGGDPA